jgi:hypothetical protein
MVRKEGARRLPATQGTHIVSMIASAVVDPLVNHILQPLWKRFRAKKA